MDVEFTRSSFCSDQGCLEVAVGAAEVLLRDSKSPQTVVRVSPEDWDAFVKGVRNDEF